MEHDFTASTSLLQNTDLPICIPQDMCIYVHSMVPVNTSNFVHQHGLTPTFEPNDSNVGHGEVTCNRDLEHANHGQPFVRSLKLSWASLNEHSQYCATAFQAGYARAYSSQ